MSSKQPWSPSPSKTGESWKGDKSSNSTNVMLLIIITIITIISSTMVNGLGSFFSPTATGTVWPHLLLPFTQIFALALPPFPHRSTVFIPLICGLVLLTWCNLCTDSVDLRALMIGQWPWYLGTITKLLYYRPEVDFWRDGREKSEAFFMQGLSAEKWKWAAALYCSPRLVGWNQQVKGVPSTPDMGKNKKEFVIERLKLLAVCFVMIDLNNLYNQTYFYRTGTDPMTLTIRGTTFYRSLLNYGLGFMAAVLNFTWLYNQIAIVSVLLGGGAPKDWPPLYGPISESYTVRRYWNTFWHQTIRHPVTTASSNFKQYFNIKRGTWLSSYIEIFYCFTLSALFHGVSTLALPVPKEEDRKDWYTRFWAWFLFMFVQAGGIVVEDGVIWAWQNITGKGDAGTGVGIVNGGAKSNGESNGVVGGKDAALSPKAAANAQETPAMWQMAVGFVWVYTFWYIIDPLTVDPLLRLGVVAGDPLPFSVVQPLLKATGMKDHVTQMILG